MLTTTFPLFQISLDCIINPPYPQEPSYPLFFQETVTFGTYAGVLARTAFNCINRIPGLTCSPVQAGYYAFIKVTMMQGPHNTVLTNISYLVHLTIIL